MSIKKQLEHLKQKSQNPNIQAMQLDLADLDSIRQFSKESQSRFDHVDLLVCNAGVMTAERRATKQGFESGTPPNSTILGWVGLGLGFSEKPKLTIFRCLTDGIFLISLDFGVNHLGHMYLTYLLLPSLRAAKSETRVVVLSSLAHKNASLHFEDLQVPWLVYLVITWFRCIYCSSVFDTVGEA